MLIARTSRSTGVGVGPIGLAVLAIGWLFLAALIAIGVTLSALLLAARWGVEWAVSRRRHRSAAPAFAPGVEQWARGHREITAREQAIMASARR